MELGATMDLLGEEVGQLWGRRPPFIVGGAIQPLPPTSAPQRAVLPLGQWYCRWAQSGTTAVVRAVLPHTSGTTAPTAVASTVKPDTEKDPSNRGGTSTKPQRYYGWGLQRYYRCGAVLPLVAPKRYYRLDQTELPKLLHMSSELSKLKLVGNKTTRASKHRDACA